MASVFELRRRRHDQGPGDNELGAPVRPNELAVPDGTPPNELDSEEARAELRQMLQWFYYERDRQAANRLDMAVDHDMYDNKQWDSEDEAFVEDRGQSAIVYNEVAPMCDWIIGTERRNRVDWKVLPRTDDDVQAADVKTKVLKYVTDVNKTPFARSRAFADSIKGGLGWVDDGACDDPTKEAVYSKYENWRHVLHDSAAEELDGSDGRYLFRWRWVDEDIAARMFPERADRIHSQVEDWANRFDQDVDDLDWPINGSTDTSTSGTLSMSSGRGILANAQRRRVRLIECQYRKPVAARVVGSGPFKGAYLNDSDTALRAALEKSGGTIVERVAMRMHFCVFTETDLLAWGPSVYRHNNFSLTPIFCYRRGRDRMPYGVIRRVRDVQRDLNKRASKALWYLNTNQIIGEPGAVDDWEQAAEEAARPDGRIIVNSGKKFEIRRDTDAATGQMQIMAMDAQSIQKSAGVSQENMGRQTNAVSGEAIKARQLQGAVVTTEPFDNARYAVQAQGEKMLSLVEQFFSEEKVIRLSGTRGALEWVRINQPEVQPDGSVRFINDITASMADFVVSEQDYAGTLRQVMFDAMTTLSQKLPPEVALRLLTMAYEFSDLPNKDEIADQLRKMTGERDPNKQMTPEEQQQAEAQMQQQAEAMQLQRAAAQTALAEQQAKVRELNARATELEAKAQALLQGDGTDAQRQIESAVRQVQDQAAQQIEQMSAQLQKMQTELANRTMQVKADADSKAHIARIQADTDIQVAEIQAASEKRLAAVLKRMEDIAGLVEDLRSETDGKVADVTKLAKEEAKAAADKVSEKVTKLETTAAAAPAAAPAPAAAAAPAPAAPAAPAQPPVVVNVQPATAAPAAPAGRRTFKLVYDAKREITGATIKREDGSTERLTVSRGEDNRIEGGSVEPTTEGKAAT